jgi:hypothetical protein
MKPDDIPQDVWDAARKLGFLRGREIIARAIMAERERCAQIAANHPKVIPTWSRGGGPPGFGAERFPTQAEIATAIRKGQPN